jgi:hypothetical protein
MKEIIEAMETFNSNLQNSRRLVKKLERDRQAPTSLRHPLVCPARIPSRHIRTIVVADRAVAAWLWRIAPCTQNTRILQRQAPRRQPPPFASSPLPTVLIPVVNVKLQEQRENCYNSRCIHGDNKQCMGSSCESSGRFIHAEARAYDNGRLGSQEAEPSIISVCTVSFSTTCVPFTWLPSPKHKQSFLAR